MVTWEEARQIVLDHLAQEQPDSGMAVAEDGRQDEHWFVVPYGVPTTTHVDGLGESPAPSQGHLELLVGDPVALVERATGALVWLPVAEVPHRLQHTSPV